VTTLEDCEQLVRLVQRTGLKFVVAQTWRNLPKIQAARRVFEEGELGQITMIDTGYIHDIRDVCKDTPWRVTAPQDFLFGGGGHPIDCVRWFAGDVDEVSAYAINSGVIPGYPLEDTWILNLRFKNGALGRVSVVCSAIHPTDGAHQRVQIFGTKGTLTGLDLAVEGLPGQTTLPVQAPTYAQGAIEGHAAELVPYFLKMARWIDSNEEPEPNVLEGARGIAVAVAARQSLASGQPVKVRNDF
jgi:predicted dehydrogenase